MLFLPDQMLNGILVRSTAARPVHRGDVSVGGGVLRGCRAGAVGVGGAGDSAETRSGPACVLVSLSYRTANDDSRPPIKIGWSCICSIRDRSVALVDAPVRRERTGRRAAARMAAPLSADPGHRPVDFRTGAAVRSPHGDPSVDEEAHRAAGTGLFRADPVLRNRQPAAEPRRSFSDVRIAEISNLVFELGALIETLLDQEKIDFRGPAS